MMIGSFGLDVCMPGRWSALASEQGQWNVLRLRIGVVSLPVHACPPRVHQLGALGVRVGDSAIGVSSNWL